MVSKKKVKSKNGVRFDSKHIRLRTGESEKDNGTYVTVSNEMKKREILTYSNYIRTGERQVQNI